MVLWDHSQALVEEELEVVVIRLHQEVAAPEVWAPVADGDDEADELAFVGRLKNASGCCPCKRRAVRAG